jgi:hypothetical protein
MQSTLLTKNLLIMILLRLISVSKVYFGSGSFIDKIGKARTDVTANTRP